MLASHKYKGAHLLQSQLLQRFLMLFLVTWASVLNFYENFDVELGVLKNQ